MTKAAQLWPGDRMLAFFRAHIRRETSLDEAAAERLAQALTKATNRMLVWDAAPAAGAPAEAPARRMGDVIDGPRPAEPAAEIFNPYLFSATIVFAKSGRDGLARRLAEIKSVENLRAFAEAQHLAFDPALKRAEEIRRALISSTEQRLADRKAAAS